LSAAPYHFGARWQQDQGDTRAGELRKFKGIMAWQEPHTNAARIEYIETIALA